MSRAGGDAEHEGGVPSFMLDARCLISGNDKHIPVVKDVDGSWSEWRYRCAACENVIVFVKHVGWATPTSIVIEEQL